MHHLYKATLYLFVILMMVIPTVFQAYRGVIFAALCVGALAMFPGRWRVSKDILIVWGVTLASGIFFVIRGMLNGTPGAERVSTVFILWPLVYMLFIGLATENIVRGLLRVLVVGFCITTGIVVLLLMDHMVSGGEWFPESIYSLFGWGIGIYDGFIEFRTYNLATLIFAFPFLVGLLYFDRSGSVIKSRNLLWLLAGLVLLLCLISGRRAFWMVALATPFLLLFFAALVGHRIPVKELLVWSVLGGVCALVVGVGMGISVFSVVDQFLLAFSTEDYSGGLRREQWNAMLAAFLESPWLGKGLGASLEGLIRSEEMPWAYELSYGALMFQTGMVGMVVYLAAVAWIMYRGVGLCALNNEVCPVLLPLLMGMSGFLLASATNPYLYKFDYLWTIFLPVAAINSYLSRR